MRKSFERVFVTINKQRKFVAAYLLLFLLYIVILPKDGHGGDIHCWREWCKYIFSNGLGSVYQSGTDYLPLYHYFLYLFGTIQGSIGNIENNTYLIKIFTLIFDFIGGFFIVKLIRERFSNPYEWFFYSMFFFLNIAVLYNTLIWGQVDGILSTLVFVSVYFAYKEKIVLTILFFILAINLKLQAIIFLPILGLLLLPLMIKRFNLINLTKWIASIVLLQLFIILPFIIKDDFQRIVNVIISSFGRYPVISMNAYNFWDWIFKGDLTQIQDSGLFFGITYKKWGLIMFFISSFVALLPLLSHSFKTSISKSTESLSIEKILITSALIPLLFFFFNTQMHERYSHPALIFVISYSILSKNFMPSIFVSIACFLNMEDVLRYLQLNFYNWIFFKDYFIAILYFIGVLMLYTKLFDLELNHKTWFNSIRFPQQKFN